MHQKDLKATILGAGIAGLSAGYKLAKAGYHPLVFEADNTIGGLASSYIYKDCIFDFGPHAFHSPNPELLQFYLDTIQTSPSEIILDLRFSR